MSSTDLAIRTAYRALMADPTASLTPDQRRSLALELLRVEGGLFLASPNLSQGFAGASVFTSQEARAAFLQAAHDSLPTEPRDLRESFHTCVLDQGADSFRLSLDEGDPEKFARSWARFSEGFVACEGCAALIDTHNAEYVVDEEGCYTCEECQDQFELDPGSSACCCGHLVRDHASTGGCVFCACLAPEGVRYVSMVELCACGHGFQEHDAMVDVDDETARQHGCSDPSCGCLGFRTSGTSSCATFPVLTVDEAIRNLREGGRRMGLCLAELSGSMLAMTRAVRSGVIAASEFGAAMDSVKHLLPAQDRPYTPDQVDQAVERAIADRVSRGQL